jgi:HAMP domain-containing protein
MAQQVSAGNLNTSIQSAGNPIPLTEVGGMVTFLGRLLECKGVQAM